MHLYWGGRNTASYDLYRPLIEQALNQGQLDQLELAFSRQESTYKFVQDILEDRAAEMAARLASGGVLMICGSLAMQESVLTLLETICPQYNQKKMVYYLNKGQILMDCY